ncbi:MULTISPECIES: ASCH domain-containing protein [Ectopseudomonas]|uniref:Uncharacterized protein n=2 Tax=Ectopseudomonas TaxID=3236654 RepID=A0A1G6PTG0_9GAMM|nr:MULTISPECIES: hypothetical protein [Pseudomonas]ALN21947.1 hypothetical protein DW68_025040 [Pseudomonas mendocina S5.2]KER98000.1 hypothetical protein HN51_24655 [Pseudomonas mendocina]MBP3061896.1 hypothetical protein [Pseudomonas chengduensis]NNB75188.1 hypothetical protein [Pseudomonas chengduensis]OEO24572.1 hypothetical protein AX279_18070 [Pseudomonas sp. J237]
MPAFRVTAVAAEAFRAGRMSQHRVPAPAGAEPPVAPGMVIELEEPAPYGKVITLGRVLVLQIERQRLEDISDEDIHACGYPNWTLFSADWTQLHGAKGFSWDVDPDAWAIKFEVCR